MGLLDLFKPKTRGEPEQRQTTIIPSIDVSEEYAQYFSNWLTDCSAPSGYRTLAEVPEIKSAIEKIAEIVSSMTIHLMENQEKGDVRIKDELSKMIDIRPNKNMSKQLFISWVVQEMMLRGNAVAIPKTKDGLLENIEPLPNATYGFVKDGKNYFIEFKDYKRLNADKVLHFRYNPKLDDPWIGQSQEIILRDLKDDLYQANKTVSDFMTTKLFPNVVIKVDALTQEFSSPEGRTKLEERYLKRSKSGQPWIIPSELMDIETIKPLTLNDIAIHDSITISKKTVASIIGVPAFLLGVGEFDRDEYNYFIRNKVAVICKAIESELTQKLLFSPYRYFQFNKKSMLNYDLNELGELYTDLFTKGIVTGNEVRDALGMSPHDELDRLIVLENYIPIEKIGNQEKIGGGSDEE